MKIENGQLTAIGPSSVKLIRDTCEDRFMWDRLGSPRGLKNGEAEIKPMDAILSPIFP